MSKIKSAMRTVLKHEPWLFLSVIAVSVGHQYWRDGQVSPIDWLGILLGILLVTVLAVLAEMYWMSKSK
jgi:hypothetical protein